MCPSSSFCSRCSSGMTSSGRRSPTTCCRFALLRSDERCEVPYRSLQGDRLDALLPPDAFHLKHAGLAVEDWLDPADEPVAAYAEPLSMRLRRWGRRHRSLVSSGVAAGVERAGTQRFQVVLSPRSRLRSATVPTVASAPGPNVAASPLKMVRSTGMKSTVRRFKGSVQV